MEDYASADVNLLFDDDVATCLDLNDYWTYLPMTTIRSPRNGAGGFTVTVNIGQAIQALVVMTTKVFVSQTGILLQDYYRTTANFSVCDNNADLSFDCHCPDSCSVHVQFRFNSIQLVGNTVYRICEINIP